MILSIIISKIKSSTHVHFSIDFTHNSLIMLLSETAAEENMKAFRLKKASTTESSDLQVKSNGSHRAVVYIGNKLALHRGHAISPL